MAERPDGLLSHTSVRERRSRGHFGASLDTNTYSFSPLLTSRTVASFRLPVARTLVYSYDEILSASRRCVRLAV